MGYLKSNKGASLIELILIVLIIAAIVVVAVIKGMGLLKTSEVEDIMTDMLTIKANAKIYAEEINSKTLEEEDQDSARVQMFESEHGMYKAELSEVEEYIEDLNTEETTYECYRMAYTGLLFMKIEDEEIGETISDYDFYVVYNTDDYSDIEVIYKPGVVYNEVTYYTLSDLQEVVEE